MNSISKEQLRHLSLPSPQFSFTGLADNVPISTFPADIEGTSLPGSKVVIEVKKDSLANSIQTISALADSSGKFSLKLIDIAPASV